MREGAKRRLTGAVAIVALAVIFVPMLFEKESSAPPPVLSSPADEPKVEDVFGTDSATNPQKELTPARISEEAPVDLPIAGESLPPPAFTATDVSDANMASPAHSKPASRRPEKTVKSQPPPPAKAIVKNPPKPKEATDGKSSWTIQVASLGTAEAAAGLEKKLRNAGFTAYVQKAEVGGKQYYRVRVGPETDQASASRTANKLRQQQKLDAFIQRQR